MRLVEVTRFIVPQVHAASAHIPNIKNPICCELLLNPEVPFHEIGNLALRPRCLYLVTRRLKAIMVAAVREILLRKDRCGWTSSGFERWAKTPAREDFLRDR